MWMVLSFVILCLPCVTGHVSLIYPPARKYAFDFMDNLLTPGPCGVPSGLGPKTTLLGGSTINVNFHLAYPHRGGFFLEVMNNKTNAIHRHPASGYLSGDTTLRSTSLTLPDEECTDCWIRLIREAGEWSAGCRRGYLFWSCADVDIVKTGFTESCTGHGTWSNNKCNCERLWVGDKCEHKVDCQDASDCNDHGDCVDIATNPNPIKHCYCQHGWHGQKCEKVSSVSTMNIDYSLYQQRPMTSDYTLYYRFLPDSLEFEMVLKVVSTNWVAIGWKPSSFRSGCQLFPNLPGATQWSEGTEGGGGDSSGGTTAEGEGEPKTESEVTSKPEGEGEPKPEVEGEPKPEGEGEPKPEGEGEPKPEVEVTPKPEGEGEPKPEGEGTPKPEGEGEPKPEGEGEPKPEGEGTPKPEGEAEAEPGTCGSSWSSPGCTTINCEYKASWTFDNTKDEITFVLESTSTAKWLAIGFSDDKYMIGSDVIYGFVQSNVPTVKDGYLQTKSTPQIDGTQNIMAVNAAVTNGFLRIEFKRARNTGDVSDKQFTDTDCYYFLYALGTVTNGVLYKHQNRWVSSEKICIKACPAPEPETEGVTTEPESEGGTTEPESEGGTTEPEGEGGNSGNCPSPLPEPGYSTGGRIYGKNDRDGGPVSNAMDCSDIIVGTARGNTSRIGDYYTRDRSTPQHDVIFGGEDSLTAAIGYENNGETVILFRRKVKATHRSDHTIERGVMSVIWAHGQIENNYRHRISSGDKPGFYTKDQLLYHGASPNRGTASIDFFDTGRDSSTSCNGKWPSKCNNCELEVSWVYNEATDDISFTLKARLNGQNKWIGVGFSKDQNMAKSDAIVGWVDNGKVTVSDRWMTDRVAPEKDTTDNIKNKQGSVVNGVTTITFDRARDTGDSLDSAFSDTECLYMFYAVGGEYTSDGSIRKHSSPPTVSTKKVCIRSCDVVSGITLISTVEVTLDRQYDAKLKDRESNEFKNLETSMKEWADVQFERLSGYKKTNIVAFKEGSIIVVADVESTRDGDSVSDKDLYKSDVDSLMQIGKAFPPQGYTITNVIVGDVRSDRPPEPFRLTLLEEIVIGLAVALIIVIIIVAVCKISESNREKVKAANKHRFNGGSSSSGSSTTSLSQQKQRIDIQTPPSQTYDNNGYIQTPPSQTYDNNGYTPNSDNGSKRSTITYDEFMKTKHIP